MFQGRFDDGNDAPATHCFGGWTPAGSCNINALEEFTKGFQKEKKEALDEGWQRVGAQKGGFENALCHQKNP